MKEKDSCFISPIIFTIIDYHLNPESPFFMRDYNKRIGDTLIYHSLRKIIKSFVYPDKLYAPVICLSCGTIHHHTGNKILYGSLLFSCYKDKDYNSDIINTKPLKQTEPKLTKKQRLSFAINACYDTLRSLDSKFSYEVFIGIVLLYLEDRIVKEVF